LNITTISAKLSEKLEFNYEQREIDVKMIEYFNKTVTPRMQTISAKLSEKLELNDEQRKMDIKKYTMIEYFNKYCHSQNMYHLRKTL
jgi:hypothetical protein